MAKKVTLAMMKGDKSLTECFTEEEAKEMFDEVLSKLAEKMGEMDAKGARVFNINPIDPEKEDDRELLMYYGKATAWVIKGICTPAAFKYLTEEMKKSVKE